MKKNTLKNLIASLMLCAAFLPTFAQNPMANLEKNYPQLTNLYRDDLGRYAAHYIFAIDVSGTMNKYADVVIPAIKPFFQALPTGDRVTVIPYGTEVWLYLEDGTFAGDFIAEDTGSNMLANSNVIDIYMGEGSYHDCILWGAQNVEVYIRATAEAEQPAQ